MVQHIIFPALILCVIFQTGIPAQLRCHPRWNTPQSSKKRSITLAPLHLPQTIQYARPHETATLRCSARYSYPAVVDFYFLKDGIDLQDGKKYIKVDNITARESSLQILELDDRDFGDYVCRSSRNRFKDSIQIITLKKTWLKWKQPEVVLYGLAGRNLKIDCGASGEPEPRVDVADKNGLPLTKEDFLVNGTEIEIPFLGEKYYEKAILCIARQQLSVTEAEEETRKETAVRATTVFMYPPVIQHAVVDQSVTLECSAKLPEQATQFGFEKEDEILIPNGKYKLTAPGNSSQPYLLKITSVTLSDYGEYSCIAGNNEKKSNYTIILQEPAFIWLNENTPLTPSVNESVIIDCDAYGDPPVKVSVAGETTSLKPEPRFAVEGNKLTIHNVTNEDNGLRVTCIATQQFSKYDPPVVHTLTKEIQIYREIVVKIDPEFAVAAPGDSLALKCSVQWGTEPVTHFVFAKWENIQQEDPGYLYMKDWPISQATIDLTNINPEEFGIYVCAAGKLDRMIFATAVIREAVCDEEWSAWTECEFRHIIGTTETFCAEFFSTRHRRRLAPSDSGGLCEAENLSCPQHCWPSECTLSEEWTDWSDCISEDCQRGYQKRRRLFTAGLERSECQMIEDKRSCTPVC